MRILSNLPVFMILVPALAVRAAEPEGGTSGAEEDVFTLGTIEVTGRNGTFPAGQSVVTRQVMDDLKLDTVSIALATQPGVTLTQNARNESIISMRGFDVRQVPVYLDGIPLYVPYDGYVDFSRFTTFDLARIQVGKGTSSLLYGPNTLGGAVNLVTRKPREGFEGDVRLGAGSGGREMAAFNGGVNQGNWYAQMGLSRLAVDTFPLGRGFRDYKQVPTDTGGERENAYARDWKVSVKAGYTPNAVDEYAIGYSRQQGEKGNPVYTGLSTQGIRFWQWPYWNKESIYLLGNTAIGANNILKTRLFQDRYDNRIDAFTDATYSRPGQRNAFPSIYNDRNTGASVEWINSSLERHELHFSMQYKEDRHAETTPVPPVSRYRDVTRSLALEDVIDLSEVTRLRLGVSRDRRDAREVYRWPTGSADGTNGLAEISHVLAGGEEIFAGVSRKTRFPTIKDRYSVRLGRALPNPDLRPETALHTEAGIRGNFWPGASGSAVLYYSRIDDLIQTEIVPSNQCGGATCDQSRNIGEARHQGVELNLEQKLGVAWYLNIAYTFLDRSNLNDPSRPLLQTPRHRFFATAGWKPDGDWEFIATVEGESGRIVPFAGAGHSQFRDMSGYGIWGLRGIWSPLANTRIEAGVDNVNDRNYELADGIPMPGRTWYLNTAYRF